MITTAEIGSTNSAACGSETSMPSTAESTEMAGVIAPSPNSRQAPPMPINAIVIRTLGLTALRWARAISARMPPSPRLSARITSSTYFTVTIRNSDQKISDRQPRISPSLAWCLGNSPSTVWNA